MNNIQELSDVLQEELEVAESLSRNLQAQKDAILKWDIETLIARAEERELQAKKLETLEQRRKSVIEELTEDKQITLKEFVAKFSPASEASRLLALRQNLKNIFSRLRIEEKKVLLLMQNILDNLREALGLLQYCPVRVYEKEGRASEPRPESGLIKVKA